MNKIALIGVGSIGKKHIANIRRLYPECIIAAASPSGRVYPDSKDFISLQTVESAITFQPDAVIIASPATSHASQIAFFQQHGIPVLVEKPLASERSDFNAFPVSGDNLAIAYCLRYLPATNIVREILAENRLGEIYNVETSVGQYLPDWRKDKDYRNSVSANASLGGGAVLELSHEIDLLNTLFGNLHVVHSHLRKDVELGLDVEEIADVVLLSNKKIYCTIHLDFLQKKAKRYLNITGSKGRLHWDLINNSINISLASGEENILSQPGYDKNNMYLNMLMDFFDMVKGESNTCVTLTEGLQVLDIIDEIKNKAVWS